MIKYIKDLVSGSWALLKGMRITMINFWRPKVTEQYPENRETKLQNMCERFRGELVMPHNEKNEHKCTGCGICQMNCPNHTIKVITRQETTEEGKTKKVLDKYMYDLGSCTFCGLCTQVCPQKAISWLPNFEHAVFTRSKLEKQLNRPGSKMAEKKVVAPAAPKKEGGEGEAKVQ
ncbi:MAG: 4Fe-4S binding protein [Paludibacteraceae bacterium]|nr:4Fe-4S binding protein [Paludibacteraceae bacterium]